MKDERHGAKSKGDVLTDRFSQSTMIDILCIHYIGLLLSAPTGSLLRSTQMISWYFTV